jgi:hypothetical protein
MDTNFGVPTMYKGIQFRSRLESIWANVFDTLDFKNEYEAIDFELVYTRFLINVSEITYSC